jgi:hypothetical protein
MQEDWYIQNTPAHEAGASAKRPLRRQAWCIFLLTSVRAPSDFKMKLMELSEFLVKKARLLFAQGALLPKILPSLCFQ